MIQNPVYPDSYLYEVYIDGAWEELTQDVLITEDTKFSYGIEGHSITDRVANSGTFEFNLRNQTGIYSPYKTTSKVGWKKGIPFRFAIIYKGDTYYRFYGRIADIEPTAGDKGNPLVRVTVLDWMDFAARQPVQQPQLQTDKTCAESVQILLSDLPIQPLNTDYKQTQTVFPTVFDLVQEEKTAIQRELYKLSLSELGYIYLQHDKNNAETLVTEGYYYRPVDAALTEIPTCRECSSLLIDFDGNYLVGMDGEQLVGNETEQIIFDNNMTNLTVSYGDNLANHITVKVYPRRVDSASKVLYSLGTRIKLNPYETITGISGNFRDPTGKATVCAKDIETSASGIDYNFTQNSDGTGLDWTTDIVVSASQTSKSTTWDMTETGGHSGYVYLQTRGKGIYTYDPLLIVREDTDSQNSYGYADLTIDQTYVDSLISAPGLANMTLTQNKDPKQTVESIDFLANVSDFLMRSFLNLNVGNLVYVKEDQTGTDGYFFINKINANIKGKIINFSYSLAEASVIGAQIWVLGVDGKTELGETTILGIGG